MTNKHSALANLEVLAMQVARMIGDVAQANDSLQHGVRIYHTSALQTLAAMKAAMAEIEEDIAIAEEAFEADPAGDAGDARYEFEREMF